MLVGEGFALSILLLIPPKHHEAVLCILAPFQSLKLMYQCNLEAKFDIRENFNYLILIFLSKTVFFFN